MLQLDIVSGTQAGTTIVARRFPFTVGRAKASDLQLSDPGVWDEHLEIDLLRAEKAFHVRCGENAQLTINGAPVAEAALRNGDTIQIGGAKIQVGVAAPVQKGLVAREVAVWLFLGILSLAQVALIYLLGR